MTGRTYRAVVITATLVGWLAVVAIVWMRTEPSAQRPPHVVVTPTTYEPPNWQCVPEEGC